MPDFVYTARAANGSAATGVLTAGNEREVMSLLDQKGLFPVKIAPAPPKGGAVVAALRGRDRKVPSKYLTAFYGQLADLLHSGVPLLRSLEILERQSASPALAEVIKDVRGQVAEGTSLADALGKHPRAFDELTVSMVRAGQEGGFLESVLQRIAEFTEHQDELRSKVVGALAYPVFLSGVGTLIVGGLIVFLVPRFETMFERQREAGTLPFLTVGLLNFSRFLQDYFLLVLLALAAAIWLFRRWAGTAAGRRTLDAVKLRLPGAGSIYRSLAIARFCRILGTMLHNGIPLLTALRIAKDSTGNRILTEAIDQAAEHVTGGKSLAAPLAASGQFPRDLIEMITVGEESNSLEKVLINIADGTERRTTRQLELFVRLLEPVMLLMMAAVTLVVVLALLMPFLQMGDMVG